jgi:hypothetical protein
MRIAIGWWVSIENDPHFDPDGQSDRKMQRVYDYATQHDR